MWTPKAHFLKCHFFFLRISLRARRSHILMRSLGSHFFREADICVLVYDVTNEASFENLQMWHNDFKVKAGLRDYKDFPFLVFSNKNDCPKDQHKVPPNVARVRCRKMGLPTPTKVSAKDGYGIQGTLMTTIQRAVLRKLEYRRNPRLAETMLIHT